MFKIEKGVPITPFRNAQSLFADTIVLLEVGDSFFVKGNSERCSAANCAKRLGIATTSRKEGTGYRIWRIE